MLKDKVIADLNFVSAVAYVQDFTWVEAIAMAIEQIEKHDDSNWISVKDALPPNEESVIVWSTLRWSSEIGHYDDGWYVEDYKLDVYDSFEYYREPVDYVTHWQKFPLPPKN